MRDTSKRRGMRWRTRIAYLLWNASVVGCVYAIVNMGDGDELLVAQVVMVVLWVVWGRWASQDKKLLREQGVEIAKWVPASVPVKRWHLWVVGAVAAVVGLVLGLSLDVVAGIGGAALGAAVGVVVCGGVERALHRDEFVGVKEGGRV